MPESDTNSDVMIEAPPKRVCRDTGNSVAIPWIGQAADDPTQRYFTGQADGLRPPNRAEELLVSTA